MKMFFLLMMMSSYAWANLHIPLDLSFEESSQWLRSMKHLDTKFQYEPYVKESIDGGEKLASWIKLINSKRPVQNQIQLTSKETQRKIPIESPSIYGPDSIATRYQDLAKTLPKYLLDIIYGHEAITDHLLLGDEEFILWARKVSALYQTAVRWVGMQPWLTQMSARRYQDVRGYYYLKHLSDLDDQLENIDVLGQSEQLKILEALEGICINTNDINDGCDKEVAAAYKKKDLKSFKDKYWNNAVRNWNRFFKIFSPRKDVHWTPENPGVMKVIFKDPNNSDIASWLKENVEDEYSRPLENWQLELSYVTKGREARKAAYIEFQKNVTPHVSGGNKIVMDANTPLDEYNVRWTIRHEYGHILGLPDCYHEFYVKEKNVMINYQLDITDLMCSRAGAMNDRIYQELKKAYLK